MHELTPASPPRLRCASPPAPQPQVHRFCFALGLLHLVLALLLIGVNNTRDRRASLQNGYVPFYLLRRSQGRGLTCALNPTRTGSWWGPKVLLWMAFVFLSFLIPNNFFMFYGSYLCQFLSSLFLLGWPVWRAQR